MISQLSIYSDLGTILASVTTLLALFYAIWQTSSIRRQNSETLARDHYQHFLELSIQYAEFCSISRNAIDLNQHTIKGSKKKFLEYEWYFASSINILEIVFVSLGHEQHWKQTIKSILGDHVIYLKSQRYDELFRATVLPNFQSFIDSEIQIKTPPPVQHIGPSRQNLPPLT